MSPCLDSSGWFCGFESLKIFPSNTCTIASGVHVLASSGLCHHKSRDVHLAMSFSNSMNLNRSLRIEHSCWFVGFADYSQGYAIAIRPFVPDIWFGFLCKWSFNPTRSSASMLSCVPFGNPRKCHHCLDVWVPFGGRWIIRLEDSQSISGFCSYPNRGL